MADTGPDDRGLSLDDLGREGETDATRREAERTADDPWARIAQLKPWALTNEPEPRRWLLRASSGERSPGFYPMGKVGILAAPGGTGKSMALVGLSLAVASGRPWLQAGRGPQIPHGFRVDTPGRVALLLAEEDPEDVARRVFHTARLMGLSAEERARVRARLYVAPLAGEDVALVDADGERDPKADALFARLKALREADPDGDDWAAVLVDPLSRFGGIGAENDNALATRAIQALERLTRLPGNPAVLMAHHERKSGASGASAAGAVRGSSAIVDGARWVARLVPVLDRDGERWKTSNGHACTRLKVVKTNYTPPLDEDPMLVLDGDYNGAIRISNRAERKAHTANTAKPDKPTRRGRKPAPALTLDDLP